MIKLNFDDAVREIKRSVLCTDFLEKSKYGMYCCPLCNSGHGPKAGGAVQYNPGNNSWWCYACFQEGKDKPKSVIDLVMATTGEPFRKVVEDLAQRANIEIDRASPEAPVRSEAPAPIFTGKKEYDFTAYYEKCRQNLRTDPEGRAYLQGRAIDPDKAIEALEEYGFGFDPASDPAAVPGAMDDTGKRHSEPRVIMPTSKSHYVARAIREDAKFKKLNPKGCTPGIVGQKFLYAGNEYVYVTEGGMDAMSFIMIDRAAIALNSTSNAEKLIKLLEEKPTRATLILCLDNDKAGKRATEVLSEGLRRLNIPFLTANMKGPGKDPNDFLVADPAAFRAEAERLESVRPDNVALYLDSVMAEDIERRQKIGVKETGLQPLDDATGGGLRPGLYLLGAGSSIGKTTFCSQIADGMAERGADVIYFSLEQSRLEMVAKSIARETYYLDPDHAVREGLIMDGCTSKLTLKAIENYRKKVEDRLSIIEAGFNCDTQYITDYVRNYYRKTGKRPVVIVDYLQVLKTGEIARKGGNGPREVVEECITQLILLKRELDITIIAIVSLNRSSYSTPFDFESIKETGLAEYSGDAVWGLELQAVYKDSVFEQDGKRVEKSKILKEARKEIPRKIQLTAIKHRGQQGSYECYLEYDPRFAVFMPGEPPKDDVFEQIRKQAQAKRGKKNQ